MPSNDGSVLGEAIPATDLTDSWIKILIYGDNGCLAGDTFLKYQIFKDGKKQNDKGGTIELLYNRFHNIPRAGKGYYQRRQTRGSDFYISSVTDDGRLTRNLITDVLDSGNRQVFEIATASGKRIKATADHEFLTESGYRALSTIRVGEMVLVSAGRREKSKNRAARVGRAQVYVKYHPRKRIKVVDGKYEYCRLSNTHLVYEACINGMSPEEYRNALNTYDPEVLDKLWVVPSGEEIHHEDENPLNDSIDNLILVDSSTEHQVEYHSDCVEREGMSVRVIPDRVVKITKMGVERTFDIKMADPLRNFIAEGFAVHNCGKTTLACGMMDEQGKYIPDSGFPKPLLLISLEPGMSGGARSIRRVPGVTVLHVKRTTKEVINPKTKEVTIEVVESVTDKLYRLADELKRNNPFKTVVIDSVTSLQEHILCEILGLDTLPAQLSFGTVTSDQYRIRSERTKQCLRPWIDFQGHTVFLGKEKDHNPPQEEKVGKTGKPQPDMRPKFIRGMQLESYIAVELAGGAAGWLMDGMEYITRLYFDRKMEEMKVGDTIEYVETGEFVRALRIGYHPNFRARFRSDVPHNLPEAIVEPTYAKIRAAIDGKKLT